MYQSDQLILLIGGNPLPNAVAGVLLGKPAGYITLLHSADTFHVAQRLKIWLLRQKGLSDERVVLSEVQENEAHSLYRAIQSVCQSSRSFASIGLHYTGGTKAMSVHAYRALKHWAKPGTRLDFSYLDANTLKFIFDPPYPESGASAQTEYVGLVEEIGLADLFALHGWEPINVAQSEPFLPLISAALLQVHQSSASLKAWGGWKEEVLYKMCRREDRPEKWKPQGQLRSIRLPWPADPLLTGLTQALQLELGQSEDTLDVEAAAKSCGKKKIEDFCQWLSGGYWLETITLQAFQAIAPACALRDLGMSQISLLSGTETGFELDVVAMRGYQLFAVSCSVDDTNKLLKSKLFEAYVRARQLGGDEARVALVCGSDDPAGLEEQIKQTLHSQGHIMVLGKQHWPNLAAKLQQWIMTGANQ